MIAYDALLGANGDWNEVLVRYSTIISSLSTYSGIYLTRYGFNICLSSDLPYMAGTATLQVTWLTRIE